MRYAKNANFARFGRNQHVSSIIHGANKDMSHVSKDMENKFHNFKMKHLLEELKKRQKAAYVF